MTNINGLAKETLLLNRYLIKQELGQGGFGRTYLIEDLDNNYKKCVLKEFSPIHEEMRLDSKSRDLFKQEAKILAKLNHPQIPQFFNWFEEGNTIFIVQQYIQGDTYWDLLGQKMKTNQLFSEKEILIWLKDLLGVIDYIHRKKIIHRDISPDNIIYCQETQKPILIDFGVVKQLIMTTVMNSDNSSAKGTIIGKRGYSAPEQLITGECYPNSDLYALAMTALVLLTGKETSLLFNSYNREKSWHSYVNINHNFREILDKMSAQYPSERYNSAQEILTDLQAIDLCQLSEINNKLEIDRMASTVPITPSTSPIYSEVSTLLVKKNETVDQNEIKIEKKSKKYIYLLCLFALFGLGGGVIGVVSPQVQVICKVLDNCARDKKYELIYEQIVKDANEILSAYSQVKSFDQLKLSHGELNIFISDLKQIPNDVKIFPQAKVKLGEYETKSADMQARITEEKAQEKNFNEILESIKKLKSKTEEAHNINTYKTLKLEWEDLKKELNSLDENTFIFSQVIDQISECDHNIENIDGRIKSLVAAEKSRREKAARLEAERRALARKKTYTPSSQPKRSVTNRISPKTNHNSHKNPISKPKPSKPTPPPVSRKGSVW